MTAAFTLKNFFALKFRQFFGDSYVEIEQKNLDCR